MVGETIRKLKLLETSLYNETHKLFKGAGPEGQDIVVSDEKKIKSLLIIQKQIATLYKMDTKSMNYYNPECEISLKNAGALINFKRNWDYEN
jgi:hypothetical protein